MFTNATFKLLQVYLNSGQSLNMACETKKKTDIPINFQCPSNLQKWPCDG